MQYYNTLLISLFSIKISSDNEYTLGAKSKSEKSAYSSIHQNGQNVSKNKSRINSDEKISKDNFAETNLYSSVHLEDKALIEENKSAEYLSETKKTKAKSVKKSQNISQNKSIKNKSDANKSNISADPLISSKFRINCHGYIDLPVPADSSSEVSGGQK